MTVEELELFAKAHGVETIMDVAQIQRAWHERTMNLGEVMTQLLYHLSDYQEQVTEQFVDLERRNVQMTSDIGALQKEIKEIKAGLR